MLMIEKTYLEYLEKTIELYPDKVKRYIVKNFLTHRIATKKENHFKQQTLDHADIIDISNKNLTDQIIACIKNSKKAIEFIEKWEFEKDYKYSSLFECDKFDEVLKKAKNTVPVNKHCENKYISTERLCNPIGFESEHYFFLKFNLAFSAVSLRDQEEMLIKYPVVVVFHEKYNLIEVRFDVLKNIFLSANRLQTFYLDLIMEVDNFFNDHFDCTLEPMSLDFLVNACKQDDSVELVAQYMKLPSGGNAQLEVGNNQEYVLPFLGELRAIIDDHQEELDKVPEFRETINQFMFEMEEMSDYPWIELLWEKEIKTRSIRVKFIFNYRNSKYGLIQHYSSNVLIGMERMNYVVKYIVDNRVGSK